MTEEQPLFGKGDALGNSGSGGNLGGGLQKPHPFRFHGRAGEYFGIWIVNLFLSIITIGIYTAWAKVRRLRYFYGNTELDGHNFEYHAKPTQILIGRIIVVVLLVVYNVLVNVSPAFSILIVPYLIAFPWIFNKALKFNARVTSYRNIRFDFEPGSYWRALLIFAVMPILTILTLFLLAPVTSRMTNNYIGNGMRYGKAKFATDVPLKPLYKNLGMTFLMVIIAMLAFGVLAAVIGFIITSLAPASLGFGGISTVSLGVLAPVIGLYIGLAVAYIFYSAGVRNLALDATVLDGEHKLHSWISRTRYTWIIVTNLLAALISLGLLIPWGAIRSWRYLMNHSSIVVSGTLDNFVANREAEGSAAAAEFFDIEGIDFGL